MALGDLTKALTLCESKGATAKNALCQRGLLYRQMKDDDAAREDFKQAACLGSAFARNQVSSERGNDIIEIGIIYSIVFQLVELNPYAALCNQMLQEACLKMS